MILWKIAFSQLRKNYIMNLFSMMQLTLVIILSSIMASSFQLRYQYYAPFKEWMQSKGFLVRFGSMAHSLENGSFLDSAALLSELPGVSEVHACNSAMIYAENTEHVFRQISYDDEILNRLHPDLSEGRWLQITSDTSIVEVVVSKNAYNWSVGDTITLQAFTGSNPITFYAKVVGQIRENAHIFGFGNHGAKNVSANTIYQAYSTVAERQPLLLFSKSALQKIENEAGQRGLIQAIQGDAFVITDDTASEQSLQDIAHQLMHDQTNVVIPLSEVNRNSRQYLLEQVQRMLPVFIIVFLLTAISCISNSALTTRRRLHDYAVYYTLGLRWKQCAIINLMEFVFLAGGAVVCTGIFYLMSLFTPLNDQFRIIPCNIVQICIVIIIVLALLISMIMPFFIIRQNTPKQILTK